MNLLHDNDEESTIPFLVGTSLFFMLLVRCQDRQKRKPEIKSAFSEVTGIAAI